MLKTVKYYFYKLQTGIPHPDHVAEYVTTQTYYSNRQVDKLALAYSLGHIIEDVANIFDVSEVTVEMYI